MSLAEALKQYLRDAMPGGALNREITPARLSKLGSETANFAPVVGGVKGAQEEWQAGNPGWATFNAATVPLDFVTMGTGGAAAKLAVPAIAGMAMNSGGKKRLVEVKEVLPLRRPDGSTWAYSVRNPVALRSRFAAFDPAKRDSDDFLAGLAPYAMPLGATAMGAALLANSQDSMAGGR